MIESVVYFFCLGMCFGVGMSLGQRLERKKATKFVNFVRQDVENLKDNLRIAGETIEQQCAEISDLQALRAVKDAYFH